MTHCQNEYGVEKGGLGPERNKEDWGDDTITYSMAFPAMEVPRTFPVEGCSGWVSTRTEMRVHFCHRHIRDTVVILEEVNLSHPRLPLCDILVPWWDLNGKHRRTSQCKQGA